MASSYLSKYYKDNNPVLSRLTIIKKTLIRIICYIICTVIFILLRLLNNNKFFGDLTPIILVGVYLVMGLSLLISILGLIVIIITLITKNKENALINRVPFSVKSKIFIFLDWLLVLPICICFALTVYGYCFRIQTVDGDSMYPTFEHQNRVLITYNTKNLKRGDVVICDIDKVHFPVSEDSFYIKRVIGLPGDSLTWNQDGLTLNGEPVDEAYVRRNDDGTLSVGVIFNGVFIYQKKGEVYGNKIPEGYVFVMGDNRGGSQDSRSLGLVPIECVLGIVRIRFDGINSIEFVERGSLE